MARAAPRSLVRFGGTALIVIASTFIVAIAELLVAVDPRLGAALDGTLVLALLWLGAFPDGPDQQVCWSVALVPLTRVLSVSLPVVELSAWQQYGVVSAVLLTAVVLAARALNFGPAELGLNWDLRGMPLQLLVAAFGLPLGLVESRVLAQPVAVPFASSLTGVFVVVLLVFSAFTEELAFRGVLQTTLSRHIGRWAGPLTASAFFATLSLSSGSWRSVLFTLCVGALFALIVARTRSIWGVSLAHGLTTATVIFISRLPGPFF